MKRTYPVACHGAVNQPTFCYFTCRAFGQLTESCVLALCAAFSGTVILDGGGYATIKPQGDRAANDFPQNKSDRSRGPVAFAR
jgi:hypothetical protein